jgi:hypothetical protein
VQTIIHKLMRQGRVLGINDVAGLLLVIVLGAAVLRAAGRAAGGTTCGSQLFVSHGTNSLYRALTQGGAGRQRTRLDRPYGFSIA